MTIIPKEQKRYVFTYNGGSVIDLNTLLTSQFHLLAIINEIQRDAYPGKKISIKVEALKEGSFDIQLLLETDLIKQIFETHKIEILSGVVTILGGVFGVYRFLKGKKADGVKQKADNKVEITLNADTIIIDQKAFEIYQNNKAINRAINKNFELLERDENIDGIEITDTETKERVIEVPKEEFNSLQQPNEYIGSDTNEKIMINQTVLIRKPDLYPKKIVSWGFIYKGRNINAVITDENFIQKNILGGERVGRGDGLICDLKIFYQWDETFQTYLETNKFEIVRIRTIVKKGEQSKLF